MRYQDIDQELIKWLGIGQYRQLEVFLFDSHYNSWKAAGLEPKSNPLFPRIVKLFRWEKLKAVYDHLASIEEAKGYVGPVVLKFVDSQTPSEQTEYQLQIDRGRCS
ncbi:MAG: hypothetical protein ABIG30_00080 [Candidatus Aenigmatarchaeota archaeon]